MPPRVVRRRRRAALLVAAVMCITACSDRPGDRQAERHPATTTTAAASAAILAVPTTPLASRTISAFTVRTAAGRLFVGDASEGDTVNVARLDPETGATLASGALPDVEQWLPTRHGVLVLHRDRHSYNVYDLDTLVLRHRFSAPGDAIAALYLEADSGEATWVGARRRDDDQLAGRFTAMSAIRLDLETGSAVESHDTPPCGPYAVVQVHRVLAMELACAYQLAILDLRTGTVTTGAAFPASGAPAAVGDDVWFRWDTFGYLGRAPRVASPGALDRFETLDLNTSSPVISDLGAMLPVAGDVWIVGYPADGSDPVLFRVDRRRFVVTARARVPGPVAFLNGRGYTVRGGAVETFDPKAVSGNPPARTVRPTLGPPPAARPESPEEAAVVDAFSTVWNVSVPNDVVAPLLGNDPTLLETRRRLVELVTKLYPGVRVRITAIDVTDGRASISYVFLRDDTLIFAPFTASLDFVDGRWQVSREAVCQLALKAAVPGC